ncbi:hypothetical protein GYH30_008460 [Glycine max]|nr:hypothetical protein GYH30_008460 [Glycine max]
MSSFVLSAARSARRVPSQCGGGRVKREDEEKGRDPSVKMSH